MERALEPTFSSGSVTLRLAEPEWNWSVTTCDIPLSVSIQEFAGSSGSKPDVNSCAAAHGSKGSSRSSNVRGLVGMGVGPP
jgi:hypothetical protein